ncbi:AbrB/MazE/SpoVT family DNA-binding domain-containing protein [Mitsuaria sp. CC2]|uniref:AbrB/MazE/SpoVT family DNA-binding domain-containing protein n=1 Tax=Mitsuaria sp. CC2 TaxID=3029186 RepID=UPI003B8D63B2
MLAKLTSKNQLTLPKSVTDKLGPVQYFEVLLQAGQVVLTPVRIQRGDAVRAKLAELDGDDGLIAQAMAFASKAAKPAAKAKAVDKTVKTSAPSRSVGKTAVRKTTRKSA